MSYYVRMMHYGDILQVSDIDREAFPSQRPPTNYEREAENWLAHYIVCCRDIDPDSPVDLKPIGEEYIFGFAGLWLMANEAHITAIAVREIHRRRGIGELLLIRLIDLALKLQADGITLEVRTSNRGGRNLYEKHGFTEVGLRHRYYNDNKEDALLMSLKDITSPEFISRLNRLKHGHSKRWEIASHQVLP